MSPNTSIRLEFGGFLLVLDHFHAFLLHRWHLLEKNSVVFSVIFSGVVRFSSTEFGQISLRCNLFSLNPRGLG